jgi:hypothetical protein
LAGLVYCGLCGRLMDSHWVHDRAGYRCRHGRTSAHPGTLSRPRILYLREDHLLDRIRRDDRLRRLMPVLGRSSPDRIAALLRADDMIVICDHNSWAVESDTTWIELTPMTGFGFEVPAQREGGSTQNPNDHRVRCGNTVSEGELNTESQHPCCIWVFMQSTVDRRWRSWQRPEGVASAGMRVCSWSSSTVARPRDGAYWLGPGSLGRVLSELCCESRSAP